MTASGSSVAKTDAVKQGSPYYLSLGSLEGGGVNLEGNGLPGSGDYDWLVTLKAVENDLWVATSTGFSPPSFGTAGINDTNIYEPGSGYVSAYVLKQGEVETFRLCGEAQDLLYIATGNTTANTQSIYSYYAVAVKP